MVSLPMMTHERHPFAEADLLAGFSTASCTRGLSTASSLGPYATDATYSLRIRRAKATGWFSQAVPVHCRNGNMASSIASCKVQYSPTRLAETFRRMTLSTSL